MKTKRKLVKSHHKDWMWSINWVFKSKVLKIGTCENPEDRDQGRNQSHELVMDTSFDDISLSDYLIITSSSYDIYLYDLAIDKKDKMLKDGFSLKPIDYVKVASRGRVAKNIMRLSLCKSISELATVVYGLHHSMDVFITKVFQSDFGYHIGLLELIDFRLEHNEMCLIGIETSLIRREGSSLYDIVLYLLSIDKHFYKV